MFEKERELTAKYNPMKPEAQMCLEAAMDSHKDKLANLGFVSLQMNQQLNQVFCPVELYILFANLFLAHHTTMMKYFQDEHGVDMMKDNEKIVMDTFRKS